MVVGSQVGSLTEFVVSDVTFDLTTTNVPDGVHAVSITGLPTGLGPQEPPSPAVVTITGGSGTLTVEKSVGLAEGTHNGTVTIGTGSSTASASITVVISAA